MLFLLMFCEGFGLYAICTDRWKLNFVRSQMLGAILAQNGMRLRVLPFGAENFLVEIVRSRILMRTT